MPGRLEKYFPKRPGIMLHLFYHAARTIFNFSEPRYIPVSESWVLTKNLNS